MRALRIAEDFVPISDFKAQASEFLRRAAASGSPLVVTQNGRPAAVLLSPEAFDELTETARFITAVQAGLDDGEAGRVFSDAAVARALERKFRPRGRRASSKK